MIINQLVMYNFGVYADTNIFKFTQEKPIVLIGGMNGRGKTTFLEAILLSLYGANSIAYKESKYNSYNQYLRSYVNKGHWSQSSFVEIDFTMNESTNDTYVIRREWDALTKITKETIHVQKNGVYNEFLTNNWAMFVENILPSALARFYFFDGEKIAELAVNDTSNEMKESIRSMLGITVLDVLKNDLGKSIRKTVRKSRKNEKSKKLEELRLERDMAIEKLKEIDLQIENTAAIVSEIQMKIEQLHKQYEVQGGTIIEQRQELILKRAKIQTDLVQNEEALVNMAATELPLKLVSDLLAKIKLQAEDEHNDFIMQQALEQMDTYLSAFAIKKKQQLDESREFVNFVKDTIQTDATEQIYELSDHALFQLNELIESALQNTIDKTKMLCDRKKTLKVELDEVNSYLNLDINEKELGRIHDQIKKAEEELVQAQLELSKYQQERSSVNSVVISKTAEYSRDVEVYLQELEFQDSADRMLKYSNMAIEITDFFAIELQKRKTGILGETITECYRKLANKKNMINEIQMNPETLDLTYLDENGIEVLKDSLSAGEKQLMVIAILWALALCSKKKLPVIIDTPLSRLDSQHRTSIVTTYFPNASEQTIILSTDTEIDQNYYDMMKDYVGDEFSLVYDEETKSTTIKKGYFQKL